jgi:hypothetical protein
MAARRRTGLVLGVALALAVAAGAGVSRSATYGLLDHFELCSGGDYTSLTGVSVRDNVYVATYDGPIRVLTQGGTQVGKITGPPGDTFGLAPLIGTSAVGSVYVIDNPLGSDPRLYKFAGTTFQREFPKDQGPPPASHRLVNSEGIFATRPGGRDVAAGEVFVFDAMGIEVWDADGNYSEHYSGPFGSRTARTVGISGVRGAIALARTSDSNTPSEVSLFRAWSKPLTYVASFDVLPFVEGVAGAPDRTWWVLGGSEPGFVGLEHYTIGGALIDRVAIPGSGAGALAVAPDGNVWVARRDGLLRIGQGGDVIPPDQYGRGKCGPPRLRTGVPENQQIVATRELAVLARCNERCTARASGTLSVPGGAARTFKLEPTRERLTAGDRERLELGLSRKAAAALRRAGESGRLSHVVITLVAVDGGKTESTRELRLTIG